MDDFEIRQVFSIIKDRVNEIKQDQDWKEKVADEWNEAADKEKTKIQVHMDEATEEKHSVYSYSKFWFGLINFYLF